MAKKKPSALAETPAQRMARWKRRAERREQQRAQEIANARAARTQKLKDAARARREEADPSAATLARRAARVTAAAKKVFEEWLTKAGTQAYAKTRAGSGYGGLTYYLRGALGELSEFMAVEVKAKGG